MRRSLVQAPGDCEEQEQPGEDGSDHNQNIRIIEVPRRDHHRARYVALCRSEPEHGAAFVAAEEISHSKGPQDQQDSSGDRASLQDPDQLVKIRAEGRDDHHHERDSRRLAADRDKPGGPAWGDSFHRLAQEDGENQRREERQADR